MSRSNLVRRVIPPTLGFSLPLEPSHLLRARELLRDYLQMHCADAELVADVVLCLEEACTNVIRHSGASEAMQVALRFTDDALVCKVRDFGHGFDLDGFDLEAVPDPLACDGRGLFMINQIMDELSLRLDDGLEVHMVKRAVPRCGEGSPKARPDAGDGVSAQGTASGQASRRR